MERCGARRSFEKTGVEAPPRLQVIGFNVSPQTMKAAEVAPAMFSGSLDMVITSAAASDSELPISPSQLSKPAASSPRSALQQLLLNQSLPSTSPISSNESLPPLKRSPNQNSKLGLQLQPDFSSPAAANQKSPSGGLLQPSISTALANQKSTSGISKFVSPPSAYQSNLSRPAKAMITENYEAFFQAKKTADPGNGAKAHEIKGPWISSKADRSHAAKSKKSSWLPYDANDDDDDYYSYHEADHPSAAERCKKSSWKGPVQPITEHAPSNEKSRKSSRSEEKSKKSSVFIMFVSSSPAPDYHHQAHSAEHNVSTAMDFLSTCHLCRRSLGHAQDIFMYSGDKAFCSMECRYQQIVIDERKERCPPSIIRSGASTEFHHSSITAKATHHPVRINKPYFINTAAAA